MKLYARWAVSAGLLLAAFPAQAQMLAPGDAGRSLYRSASDLDEPYESAPPGPPSYAPYAADPYVPAPYAPYPPNAYVPTPYAYEPAVVAAHEIYAVLRENGFVPLGILHREGFVYSISAVDPDGEDGRVLIDARTGRILRFMPAYSWGGRGDASPLTGRYAAQAAAASPAASTMVRALPRPPAAIPHVASRSPKPTQAKPADAAPSRAAVQKPAQSAAAQVQSGAPAAPAAATAGETKPPSPVIRPTEPMPQVQGLE